MKKQNTLLENFRKYINIYEREILKYIFFIHISSMHVHRAKHFIKISK